MQPRLLIVIAIISLIVLYNMMGQKSSGPNWTVYGTMGCGWTRKQLDYMKNNGKSYTFVDCDNGGCSDMKAYPTLVHPNGERIVGYKEV